MKIVRFDRQGTTAHGGLEGDNVFPISGSIYADFIVEKTPSKLSEVTLRAPRSGPG